MLFSQYVNKNFLFAAVLVLRNSGVFEASLEEGRVVLNIFYRKMTTCCTISLVEVVQKVPKYEARNELEKMCAQVGLINMHYYNMDQQLEKSY